MRIDNSYILDQPKLPASNSAANQAGRQRRSQHAEDSYNKSSAAAQVIDAEYVDLYSPDNKTLQQEQQDIPTPLKPEIIITAQKLTLNQGNNSVISRYETTSVDVPTPGTYLNIFA